MFWQFENGTLLNLNALESIYLHHNEAEGIAYVRGNRLDVSEPPTSLNNFRPHHIDLFSSKDVEHVKMVLNKIANRLEYNEL